MYALKPTRIYMHEPVRANEDAFARMTRILKALGYSMKDVVPYSRDDLYNVARDVGQWSGQKLLARPAPSRQRQIVFTNIVFDRKADDDPLVAETPEDIPANLVQGMLGYIAPVREHHGQQADTDRNMVCWTTQDFGTMLGCPHGCQYCGQGKNGKAIVVGVNIDEFMEKGAEPVILRHPDQKCFRMIGWGADHCTFEPEYGCMASFLTKLAEHNRYGYFHTNSDNVDWVESVPHRDRLIGVWSMASEAQATLIEPGAPTAAARIEAARKCQQWDVPVRFKFKPMVPVRGWREEYASLIENIFARTRPESLGFCVIMWMNLDNLAKLIDLDVLDPDCLQAARDAEDPMRDRKSGPFPHAVRKEIYRFLIGEARKHDAKVPLYISTETREMWSELKGELGQNPRSFICGCNPVETPGPCMRPSGVLQHSTYFDPVEAGAGRDGL